MDVFTDIIQPAFFIGVGIIYPIFTAVRISNKRSARKRTRISGRQVEGIAAASVRPAATSDSPAAPKRKRVQPSPETIQALHKQVDAERHIAEALERRILHESDPLKSARLEKQACAAWVRFYKTLDRIDQTQAIQG